MGLLPNSTMNFIKITNIGIIVALVYVLSYIFNIFQNVLMSKVNAKLAEKLRSDIDKKISKLPLKYLDKNSTGDILSRIANDVDTISGSLNQSLITLITSVINIVGILVIMFTISAKLTLISLVGVPLCLIASLLIVKYSQKYFTRLYAEVGNINGYVEEHFSAHNIVMAYNFVDKSCEDFNKINDNLYKVSRKAQFLSSLMGPIMSFIGNLVYVLIGVVGGTIALNNPLFIAGIISTLQYAKRFNMSVSQLGSLSGNIQSMIAASERVFEFLNENELEDESHKQALVKYEPNKIEFKNVVFGYDENKIIINNFSQVINKGEKVAIVGPTGAGKTTIVNLLMRFYDVNSGDILIDNNSIYNYKREDIRNLFGMVLQDTWLFQGTIKENLKFGNETVTDEEIVNVCKLCKVHHFIKSQPNGYNTVLNEDSFISGGQKQLLTIARAMLSNSPMLILDEATSSVDTRTEVLIQNAMDNLMKNRTSFIIAHRLSTIKNADLILVLKDGEIIEKGTHEELIALNGFYTELYNSQFSLQDPTFYAEE